MNNSYAVTVQGLYSAIFTDIRAALPSVSGLERDEHRLHLNIESRGLRFCTIDLPDYGKHFDLCLSAGRLTPSNLPCFGWSGKGARSHAFLRGLVLRVFDSDGMLLSQPCHLAILFIRQLCYAVKKIKLDCSEQAHDRAITKYIRQEDSLRSPSLNWGGDHLEFHSGDRLSIDDFRRSGGGRQADLFEVCPVSASFCDTVHDVADRIFSSFGEFKPEEWRVKHGPGAVADRPIEGYKYNFPTWSDRLEHIFPCADLAYANYSIWADMTQQAPISSDDEASVLLAVPKSQKTPRLIAKEPTANMWCQQAVRDYLEQAVSASPLAASIHFKDQRYNANAALEASRSQTHWTVDLSDASDRVSLWLVERLARANKSLLEALNASRSTYVKVPLKSGSTYLRMKKFAPQGSATTFPLQSIIYACVGIASIIYADNRRVTPASITAATNELLVFGDDTIIPARAGEHYVKMLTYLGFLVNYNKTFGTGKFRESCGSEGYDGTDVTPAYFVTPFSESSPTSIASVVECSNNFYKKGFWHTAAWAVSTLPPWAKKSLQVRGCDDGRFGLLSFCGSRPSGINRWNVDLQRMECLALSVRSAPETRRQPGGYGHLLQYFTEKPAEDIDWMSGVDGRVVSSARRRWEPVCNYA